MNRLSIPLLFLVAWLVVFAATQFPLLRGLLGAPVNLLPALVVYAALEHSLVVLTALTVIGGVWFDSLSGSRLGLSVAPLFLAGGILNQRQHLLLRRHRHAQFWLGLFAGIGIPVASGILLRLGDAVPYHGPGTLWQLAVGGLANGVACPVFFALFETLKRLLEYQQSPMPLSMGPERQMKRGRT